MHINTKVKKALDDADKIEFEPQGTPNANNTWQVLKQYMYYFICSGK
jgi:hypothetical protein